jgi:hypothetical protein
VLEPVFEADFLPCSFGFRPRLSAHDALQVPVEECARGRRWVVETDIASCFSAIPRWTMATSAASRAGTTSTGSTGHGTSATGPYAGTKTRIVHLEEGTAGGVPGLLALGQGAAACPRPDQGTDRVDAGHAVPPRATTPWSASPDGDILWVSGSTWAKVCIATPRGVSILESAHCHVVIYIPSLDQPGGVNSDCGLCHLVAFPRGSKLTALCRWTASRRWSYDQSVGDGNELSAAKRT